LNSRISTRGAGSDFTFGVFASLADESHHAVRRIDHGHEKADLLHRAVTPPALTKSPTFIGRSTIVNAPAAKFVSNSPDAISIATPAAARIAAKLVV
jgi:hypothetical protein